jgi:hypothetical protein
MNLRGSHTLITGSDPPTFPPDPSRWRARCVSLFAPPTKSRKPLINAGMTSFPIPEVGIRTAITEPERGLCRAKVRWGQICFLAATCTTLHSTCRLSIGAATVWLGDSISRTLELLHLLPCFCSAAGMCGRFRSDPSVAASYFRLRT